MEKNLSMEDLFIKEREKIEKRHEDLSLEDLSGEIERLRENIRKTEGEIDRYRKLKIENFENRDLFLFYENIQDLFFDHAEFLERRKNFIWGKFSLGEFSLGEFSL